MPERDRLEKRKQKRTRRALRREEEKPHVLVPAPSAGLALSLVAADVFTRAYRLHGQEVLSSYGHDVLGIPLLWVLSQKMLPRVNFFKSRANIALLSAAAVGFEAMEYVIAQRTPHLLEEGLYGAARFDPNDFIAYGVGTAAALGLHKLIYGRPITPPQKT